MKLELQGTVLSDSKVDVNVIVSEAAGRKVRCWRALY